MIVIIYLLQKGPNNKIRKPTPTYDNTNVKQSKKGEQKSGK